MKFLHLGIVTKEKKEGARYIEDMKLYITDPENHPYKLEFLRFEEGSPLPQVLQENVHICIKTDNIEETLKDFDQVVFGPLRENEKKRICFALKDGVLFEFHELKE